jgi:hypothetical protein
MSGAMTEVAVGTADRSAVRWPWELGPPGLELCSAWSLRFSKLRPTGFGHGRLAEKFTGTLLARMHSKPPDHSAMASTSNAAQHVLAEAFRTGANSSQAGCRDRCVALAGPKGQRPKRKTAPRPRARHTKAAPPALHPGTWSDPVQPMGPLWGAPRGRGPCF